MCKILFIIALFIPNLLLAQQNLKEIRKESYQVFAYKVDAASAEKYILKDSIDVDAFLSQSPAATFPADSVDEKKLPIGHYVLISIKDNRIIADLIGVSDLYVYPVNNLQHVQLLVTNKNGNYINNAKVWVNRKEATYNKNSQSYFVKQKKPDETLIKVYAQNDTLFSSLIVKDELNRSVSKQHWDNFKRTWFARTASWLPQRIHHLFKKTHHYKSYNIGANGMMVFNQPKYKQTDTVKLKAYVFTKKWKQYRSAVNVFLEFYSSGKSSKIFLKKLHPSSPGSYIFQFPLSDTLQSDLNYTIEFRTEDDKRILSNNFRIEDYLLDEISTYNIRSTKETYYKNDTMHFFVSADNANGLSVLDGSAKLVLLTETINRFYSDSLYVPDTLFVKAKPLATTGETTFDFPTNKLPNADLDIKAKIIFKNGNNELQEKDISINYRIKEDAFTAFIENDSVVAMYKENGKTIAASGILHIHNDWDEIKNISYPYKIKINSLANAYSFYIIKDGIKTDSAKVDLEDRYEVDLSRISRGDTLGFVLNNPFAIPVSFTVFDGNKITGSGKSSDAQIIWTTIHPNKNHAYRVTWQYYWKGEEKTKEQSIALLYKLLNVDIKNSSSVFPGQKDNITINVRDYKNNPVEGVNLTAVSYNNQFNKDISVPDPPYLVKYKMRTHIRRENYENEEGYILKKYPLGLHEDWIRKFEIDSMLYYKMLFPKKQIYDAVSPISDLLPQLSVHVVDKGERQEIYMLYINRRLTFYNGVTERMNDAYQTYLGYSQIGIRLNDKLIEIDSIYIQPYYKHDLFIDINDLPAHSKVTKLPPSFTDDEKQLLERSLWSLDNNSRTNNGYIWQYEKLVRLSGYQNHVVGPFVERDPLHFYAPTDFDIEFPFESGYQYNLSPKISRLEKRKIFPDNNYPVDLPQIKSPEWILGDTILSAPIIKYKKPLIKEEPYLRTSNYYDFLVRKTGNGKLHFTAVHDTTFNYVVLYPSQKPKEKIIFQGYQREIQNISPGEYTLMLIDRIWKIAEIKHIIIKENKTYCIHTEHAVYKNENDLVAQWIREQTEPIIKTEEKNDPAQTVPIENMPEYISGKAGIKGNVIDKTGGNGIPGASIYIKGSKTGSITKIDGTFIITNIKPGKCILVIASIGYVSKELTVDVPDDGFININIALSVSTQALQEVVVTGYGITREKKSLSFSTTTIKSEQLSLANMSLEGRVAGVQITNGDPGNNANIIIRGISSNSNQPSLFVIDGIIYDQMPGNISEDMIGSINILKSNEATSLYGARAANGVAVITTKTKSVRNKFRNYAFWQPELFTDKNGEVKFSVEYPDNVTGWQTFVLGMDKKRRMGKSFSFVKSYKPLMAQINMPQFLIVGDSVDIIGKSLNYSNDDYSLKTNFKINNQSSNEKQIMLKAKESAIEKFSVIAPAADTIEAAFHIKSSTGFNDEEERKMPILQKGTLEAQGKFWVLGKDTTVHFIPAVNNESIECYAQNNTLDILLDEINYLKKYPYYCMEQTASKLRGLLMEKIIKEKLQQKFDGEKDIQMLVSKLQKNQMFDGSWSWWENGRANLFITNYVINALLPIRSQGMIETNIRNGLLYLQNQLPVLNKEELLSVLLTMSEAKHVTDYQSLLKKINFDSLSTNQQWQYVKILQAQNLEHSNELNKLFKKSTEGILGSMHWGDDNFRWYGDANATTVTAFEVLQKEKNHDKELNAIVQYFLEQRGKGYWPNTVASASIVSALLPYVLSTYKDFTQPAEINITGDTSFSIKQYPFKLTMKRDFLNPFTIHKTGGGLTYLTFYQQLWNKEPEAVTNYFNIESHFEKNSERIMHLTSGEKVKMIIEINAMKEADYVMIEIPIPAGCTYASKAQDDWGTHKEFLKNKLMIFSEKIAKGIHHYEIELESRYNGIFTLNPTKASLMYFPTFYGRNEMQKIIIKPEHQ